MILISFEETKEYLESKMKGIYNTPKLAGECIDWHIRKYGKGVMVKYHEKPYYLVYKKGHTEYSFYLSPIKGNK